MHQENASTVETLARSVGLIGASESHRKILEKLHKVAPTDAEVLITGPSGIGKELYARFVHEASRRTRASFVPVNCGAIPDNLFENELFGHAAGAFTGAQGRAEGLVHLADGGTLFLDEVDSLPLTSQVKLLRFLQEGEYRRLGESSLRRAAVRTIAATNADLVEAVRREEFRQDLFFRLRVVPVAIAPLRQRREDIAALLSAFTQHYAELYELPPIVLAPSARGLLEQYPWPGNIRELQNCVKSLTCQQLGRPVVATDLALLDREGDVPGVPSPEEDLLDQPFQEAKRRLVERFERNYIEAALERSGGNIARAAQQSGKHRRAFFELMRKHGIDGEAFRPSS